MKIAATPVYGNLLIILMICLLSINLHGQEKPDKTHSVAVNVLDDNMQWGTCPDFIPSGCNIAILNGDPASNNADAVFKFEPNTEIPEHWHNSAERMILIQGELEVTYEGEDTNTLKAGYYAYGPAKKPHKARCNGDGPCILFVAFEKPVDAYPGNGK